MWLQVGSGRFWMGRGQPPYEVEWGKMMPTVYSHGSDTKRVNNIMSALGGSINVSHLCGDCGGDGLIGPCEECNEGMQQCHDCDGGGSVSCDYCDGEGHTPCDYCDGGVSECSECYGDGEVACDECDGDQLVACDECDGAAEVECDGCEGGATVDCEECDTEGVDEKGKTCPDCMGEGHTNCEDCEGEGMMECPSCDKTGEQTCDECADGTQECSDCGGMGTGTCYDCDGEGTEECGECVGGGTETCGGCDGHGEHHCYECDGEWQQEECGMCDTGTIPSESSDSRVGQYYLEPIFENRQTRVNKLYRIKKTAPKRFKTIWGGTPTVSFVPARKMNSKWFEYNFNNLRTVTNVIYPAIIGEDGNQVFPVQVLTFNYPYYDYLHFLPDRNHEKFIELVLENNTPDDLGWLGDANLGGINNNLMHHWMRKGHHGMRLPTLLSFADYIYSGSEGVNHTEIYHHSNLGNAPGNNMERYINELSGRYTNHPQLEAIIIRSDIPISAPTKFINYSFDPLASGK